MVFIVFITRITMNSWITRALTVFPFVASGPGIQHTLMNNKKLHVRVAPVSSSLYAISLLLLSVLSGCHDYCPQMTDKDTEAQTGQDARVQS